MRRDVAPPCKTRYAVCPLFVNLHLRMTQPAVTIYSTPTCHYCNLAKEFFKQNGVTYTEINVGADKEKAREMVKKTGQMGVPVIEVGNETIIGFNEEKLRALLSI